MSSGSTGTTHKFNGKERDYETGSDYFGARYYANWNGRFTRSDPDQVSGFENIDDPQSWNGYAYARNNPLTFVDPDGEAYKVCDEHGQNCSTQSDPEFDQNKENAQKNSEIWKDGKIFVPDENGNLQFKGTYSDLGRDIAGDPAANRQAAAFIVNQFNGATKEFAKNAAYAVAGALILRGIAAGYEAYQAGRAAAQGARVIFRAQQLEHALRIEAGHSTVLGTVQDVKTAVSAAVQAGQYTVDANGVVRGAVQINGVTHEFTGWLNPSGDIIFSNIYKQ